MYCPNCGQSINGKLKYCNGCGERLDKEVDKHSTPGKMLDNILTTLFWFTLLGLGILVGLAKVLLDRSVGPETLASIIIAYLATIFGISFLLARQIPKLIDAKLRSLDPDRGALAPAELSERTTAQLEEFREPVMSVTDHTTRTLEKAPVRERS